MKKFQKIMKDFNVHRVLCLLAFLLCLAGAAKAGQASAAENSAANLVLEEPRLKGASSVSSCKNRVFWEPVENADGYVVYRRDGKENWKLLNWVKSASAGTYTDTSVKAGNVYRYTVAAYRDQQGKKVTGGYQKDGTYVVTLCKAPVLKSVKASYKKTMKICWKPVKGADGYFIYRKTGKGKYKKVGTVKDGKKTSYTNKKISLDKKYTYKVAAYKNAGDKKICGEQSKKAISEVAEVYLGKNGIAWPCPGNYRITSRFGKRSAPARGASTFHRGIDISADRGDAIISIASGKVVEAGYSSAMGNYVKIDHGNGLCTMYEHASKLCVKRGQKVKKGKKIAKVGSTGISTGSHLHFNVIYKGEYRDPLKYL